MLDDWFSYKLAPDGDVDDGCHPQEAQAMKDYLAQKATAAEAAQAITRPIETTSNPREDLARLWGFLMDGLVELPTQYTEPLIALLKAIEDLPEPDFTAIEETKRPAHGKLWKKLPGFGHQWADRYQSGVWKKSADTSNTVKREFIRVERVKIAEIEARIVAAGLGGIPIDWGYEVVADALESSNAMLDFEIPAAAHWLHFCGERFRQGAKQGEESWALKPHLTESSAAPSRDLWKEPLNQVMSLERWSFWEERLRALLTGPGLIQDAAKSAIVQGAATSALISMQKGDHKS